MGKYEDTRAEIAGLREDIDAYQAAVAAQDVAQEAAQAALQALVDQAGDASNAQLQTIIDDIKAARDDVKGTLPPAEPPVEG